MSEPEISARRFTGVMTSRTVARLSRLTHARLAEDVDRLAADAGISHAALARAAGISPGHLADVLSGKSAASIDTYAKLADALGADLSARLYPNTGPKLRDGHQARILEGLLEQRHPKWQPFTEVAVRAPARGWIDVVLHERRERVLVATEIESGLRRLEQLIRWSTQKADAIPSWSGFSGLGDPPSISRLLLVRRTRTTREIAATFEHQLRVAYPAHPDDAIAALTGTLAWPGPSLVWVSLDGERVRLLSGR